jgi:hypothetical protein
MRYFIAIMIIILGFQAFIYWPVRTAPQQAAIEWRSEQEKREFHRLLRKHGLQHDVSVIYGWPKKPYYINNRGQKCRFM